MRPPCRPTRRQLRPWMRCGIVPLALALVALAGCVPEGVVRGAALQPVAGPLFESRGPTLRVVFSHATTGQGTAYVTMPDGEELAGSYQTLQGFSTDAGQGVGTSGQVPIAPDDWRALYGKSDMVTGQINGEALCLGGRGTVLRMQYVVDPFNDTGFGVAKDNRGNLYRLRF